ncbi:MAG: CoA transferase [Frankiales bacterium]|nr:CoA transferase [Frankiales bacterium]
MEEWGPYHDEDAKKEMCGLDFLSDLRVVEIAEGIAGPYCGKLFVDAGADVLKIETALGDHLRGRAVHGEDQGDGDSALFRYLNAAKRSTVLSGTDVVEVAARADVVIEGNTPARVDIAALRAANPRLVVVSITPYGRGGAWETRPATEFTVQAEGGGILGRGLDAEPPVQVGARLSEYIAGAYGAVGALAAARHARRTGRGEHVDVSLMETITLTYTNFRDLSQRLSGQPLAGLARLVERPSIEPTLDGWVGFNTNTRPQLDAFLVLLGRADLLDDERFTTANARRENAEEFDRIVREVTTTRTTADLVEQATLLRVPVAPVLDGPGILAHEHFRGREALGPAPDLAFEQPYPPYRLNGERPYPRGRAPRLGEHSPRAGVPVPPPLHPGEADALPLSDLRVLDATAWWAGPSSTQLLASLGADVIHLESVSHPDGARMVAQPSERFWERSHLYLATNTNKRDLTLSLGDPRARGHVERLIGSVDLVVENFSPRVFDGFGLTWDLIRSLNPRASLIRMPAFGLDGPWRDNVGFAQTMEQMTGMAWMTGYPDQQPRIPLGPCDPNAGSHATFALLVALWHRDRTGGGSFVEACMAEAALNVAAEVTVCFSAYQVRLSRNGNRGPDAAPQGLYRCGAAEEWLAIAVATDEQWAGLVALLGHPTWASDPALAHRAGRIADHDLIDRELAAWLRDRDVAATADLLVGAGIPAAHARDPRRTSGHPRHVERGFFEPVAHPLAGELSVPRPPFRFSSIRRWNRTPAPLFGEHNRELITGLLGAADEDYRQLVRAGVVGHRPLT